MDLGGILAPRVSLTCDVVASPLRTQYASSALGEGKDLHVCSLAVMDEEDTALQAWL